MTEIYHCLAPRHSRPAARLESAGLSQLLNTLLFGQWQSCQPSSWLMQRALVSMTALSTMLLAIALLATMPLVFTTTVSAPSTMERAISTSDRRIRPSLYLPSSPFLQDSKAHFNRPQQQVLANNPKSVLRRAPEIPKEKNDR